MENQHESRYVNPSQVLDYMVSEFDDPNVAVDWLKDAVDVNVVVANSLCWRRMFQLDFFLKLSQKNMDWILLAAGKVAPAFVKASFAWQVLASKSPEAKFSAYYRARLCNVVESSGLRHPYAFGHGKYIQHMDEEISMQCASCGISFPRGAGAGFSEYLRYADYSLFAVRIAQADVFSACSDAQKWEMLQRIAKRPSFRNSFTGLAETAVDFILQILTSGEDDAVKLESYDCLVSKDVSRYQWSKAESALSGASSVQELLVKADVEGETLGLQLVKCLLQRRPKWIVEWAEFDPEGLDQILPISEFVGKNSSEILAIRERNRN